MILMVALRFLHSFIILCCFFGCLGDPQHSTPFYVFLMSESPGSPHSSSKVKSLQALFALATEVLRLFGDFADQVLLRWEGRGGLGEGRKESMCFCHLV